MSLFQESVPITGAVERRVLRDRVYDVILDRLMNGEVQPGVRLGIDILAKELDVSPTPVREALVQLERTGLVSREARRGYRVAAPLSVAQTAELFDARIVIETGAAALAAPRAGELLPRLVEAEERHHRTADAVLELDDDDPRMAARLSEYFDADWRFHQAIFDRCENTHLQQMAESLGTHMHRRRQSSMGRTNDVAFAVAEHDAIVDAFRVGEVAGIVDAMRSHVSNVKARAIESARAAEAG
ncbi:MULTISPECIES: GntR family transcriptional regulator [Microbacterium]|uniref:GntR family transcriptional regulator n=1 Tax=Microbacterium TaxID=33882 RepID=UPI002781771D|nr:MULTISPECIES: GntR family transcriptional regulator [Microbacterium]MDQ1082709.1 DNA-binding GntR family transcriptional regulator [Microbacterium sp. SORGH_AS_0344]MDQ1168520.1 DNA-binding GntR family transcriptional regulator [Microbacterium proteolyticum]